MPRPRFFKLEEEKQNTILEVAAKEFADKGFKSASYNKIMEILDISKGAMYYYFEDKADLYRTVMQKEYEPCIKALWEHELDTSSIDAFWSSLAELYKSNLRNLMQSPYALPLFKQFVNSKYDQHTCSATKEFCDYLNKWCLHILKKGQSHGIIRTDLPIELQSMIFLGIMEAIDTWSFSNTSFDIVDIDEKNIEEMIKKFVDVFKRVTRP